MLNLSRFTRFSWGNFGLEDLLRVKDLTFFNSAFNTKKEYFKLVAVGTGQASQQILRFFALGTRPLRKIKYKLVCCWYWANTLL